MINLGVEGCMISGACAGFIVTAKTGSPYLGILAAIIAGAAMASIHAFMVVTRGANQLASGLALMFLGLGLTAYMGRPYVSEKINGLNDVPIPLLSDLPFFGSIIFDHDILDLHGVPAGAGDVVVPVSHPLGPAGARRG